MPKRLRLLLQDHQITTAQDLGWSTIENGALLQAAEAAKFDLMVTCDQNIAYQQNLKGRVISLVVLSTNDWSVIQGAGPLIAAAIERSTPGSSESVNLDHSS